MSLLSYRRLVPSYYSHFLFAPYTRRSVLTPLRKVIRPLFFPLLFPRLLNAKRQKQLIREKAFFSAFWNERVPSRPELSHHKAILDNFDCRQKEFKVFIQGEELKVRCCVIESKNASFEKECYNLVHALGIACTSDNNIMQSYPLLKAYLNLEKKLPARFILVSQYETRKENRSLHKVETLSEAGLIFAETLKALEETYGTINQVIAHSLGGIVAAASLKFFHKEKGLPPPSLASRTTPLKTSRAFKTLPKHILFDRAPSSIKALSSNHRGGALLFRVGKVSGWDLDLGKEIATFIQNCEEKPPSITIVSTSQDHRFEGNASLYKSPHPSLETITKLMLSMPWQYLHPNSHHGIHLGNWYSSHLEKECESQNFILGEESLADAIIRNST